MLLYIKNKCNNSGNENIDEINAILQNTVE